MARASKTRTVLCPGCDTQSEVPQSSMSMLCPGCHQHVKTEDLTVKSLCAVKEFFTAGDAVVEKSGHVVADVRVGSITVKGQVKGPIHARQNVELRKTARVYGDIRACGLSVEAGAVLVGRIEIRPNAMKERAR